MEVIFKMLVGLPASGKSTFAENLKKEGYSVFSSDSLREKEGLINNETIFMLLQKNIISTLKKGTNSILDATNLGRKKRENFIKNLRESFRKSNIKLKIDCDLFIVPIDVCKERNKLRKNTHGVDDAVIDRMVKGFSCPWYTDGFDEILLHIYSKETSLGFTMDDLRKFQQDNPHHVLTVGEHELKAFEYIKEHCSFTENYPFLLEASLHHDDGKYFTKVFKDSKGNPTKDAHYYNHEYVGSYLYLIRSFCNCTNSENLLDYEFTDWAKLYISTLISLHMRPLNVWSKSEISREKDRKKFGKDMFEDLCNLSKADLYAH